MTVIIVPTWAVWLFAGLSVAHVAALSYKIVLLRRLELLGYSGSQP